jgi:hypothetical protein
MNARIRRILKEVVTGLYYLGLFCCFYTMPWYVTAAYMVIGNTIRVFLESR